MARPDSFCLEVGRVIRKPRSFDGRGFCFFTWEELILNKKSRPDVFGTGSWTAQKFNYTFETLVACWPFGPRSTSNSTVSPSFKDL